MRNYLCSYILLPSCKLNLSKYIFQQKKLSDDMEYTIIYTSEWGFFFFFVDFNVNCLTRLIYTKQLTTQHIIPSITYRKKKGKSKIILTLSNPAMFLFSAKNSAGDSMKEKSN